LVPRNETVLGFDTTPTFVVIPADLSGKSIESFVATYGQTGPTSSADFTIYVFNDTGSYQDDFAYTHPGGAGNNTYTNSSISILVQTGYSIFVQLTAGPDSEAKGYTITLTLV
jgi:hypothetical protein